MYAFMSELLSDKKGGTHFSCFGLWHLIYLLIAMTAMAIVIVYLKNKEKETAKKALSLLINCAFGLYIAPYVMPFINIALFFFVKTPVSSVFKTLQKHMAKNR